MRTLSWTLTAVAVGWLQGTIGTARADDSFAPCWRGRPGTTFQNWSLNASNNPAAPEAFTNPNGTPSATFTLGAFGRGWLATGLGSKTGLWTLGTNGQVSMLIPNYAGTAPWKYVNVQVTYFDDGGFGTRPPTASVPGATLLTTDTLTNEVVSVTNVITVGMSQFTNVTVFGNWVTRQTIWLLQPCPSSETVVLTANGKDALIDQFIVDTRCGDNGDGDVPAFQPCWRGGPGTTFQHWLFGVPDNPAAAEIVNNPYGAPQATVVVGSLSSGYVVDDPFLGCRQGIWNLDIGGTMTLSIPNDPAAPVGAYKYVRVQTTQYRDGSVFTANAIVSISGATLVSQQEHLLETTPFGARWIVHQTIWRLPTCPASESVVLTGPANGSLIDQVVVDTICINPSCPGNIGPIDAEPGECSALVALPTAPVDACVVTSVVCRTNGIAIGNPHRFPIGTTAVNCVVTDGEGGTTSCNFTVQVRDTQPPTVTCPGDLTVARDPSLCGANVTFTATVSDNCPGANVTCVPASGAVFPLGVTPVSCTAQDASGNLSSPCTFNVRVVDFTGDVVAFRPCWRGLPGSTFQHWAFAISNNPAAPELVNNPFGAPRADILVGFFSSGYVDTDPFLGCRQGIWNLDTLGTITLTVSNSPSPPPTAYKYVRVQVTQYRDGSVFTANAAVGLAGATLVSQQEQTIETTVFGARWIVQQTIWQLPTCPVSEEVVITGPFNGSLIDQVVIDTYCVTPPTCPVDIAGIADLGLCAKTNVTWTLPAPDGCTILSAVCRTNGVLTSSGGTFPVGATPVACVITDAEGGILNCNFTVTITDTQAPLALCRDIMVALDGAGQAVITASQVDGGSTDNCGVASLAVSPSSFTCLNLGPNLVTLTVTDVNGLSSSCVATVTVIDNLVPQITCPANVVTNTTGLCDQIVSWPAPLASDNCAVTNVSCVPASGSTFAVGVTTVSCTALDSSGNPASCSFTVTVNDAEPPTIACPANVTTNATEACNQVVTWSAPVASDNCAVTNVSCAPASGSTFAVGATTVTCTALDASGNSASCSFTVTVQPVADLSVQVVASPDPVTVGQPISYAISVSNAGPCAATGVVVNNVLSAGQVLVSVTDPGMSTARACPTPGPSAWWRAEGNAADSVGTSHGTAHGGVAFTSQVVGQGFSFDGVNDYISVPDAPALRPASLTIEGWIKIGDPNGLHVLLSKPQGAGTADSYSLWIGSGVLFAAVSDSAGSGPLLSYPNFPSSSIFSGSDIIDLPSLAAKLKTPADAPSVFLNSQLSAETITLLNAYGGGADPVLVGKLVADLNQIIQSGPIYAPAFTGVTLAPETQYLLGRNPTGIDLVRLNRLLIRDAYPTEIQSNLFPELNIRYHVAYTFDPVTQKQALYVNGALVDSSFINKTIAYDGHALFFGAHDVGGSAADFYQGELDELSIYDRALSGIEVEALYNAGSNGRCFNTGPVAVGTLASGATQSLTVVAVPTVCPNASLQATVTGTEIDPAPANNSATATASVAELPDADVRLSIRRVSPNNNHVEISWPITCAPFQLQTTSDLSPYPAIIWVPATVPVQTLQGRYSTVIPADDAHRFFRLEKP